MASAIVRSADDPQCLEPKLLVPGEYGLTQIYRSATHREFFRLVVLKSFEVYEAILNGGSSFKV
jgi:hypothetical protein